MREIIDKINTSTQAYRITEIRERDGELLKVDEDSVRRMGKVGNIRIIPFIGNGDNMVFLDKGSLSGFITSKVVDVEQLSPISICVTTKNSRYYLEEVQDDTEI